MKLEKATFGAGCFWCVENIFASLKGVEQVRPGYTGGTVVNPTYEEVCTGNTGHAEVCQIEFNPEAISFSKLLEVFWKIHDPTTLNRQGPDLGTQYRSAVFCHTKEQWDTSKKIKAQLESANIWNDPVVTEIIMLDKFFPAEEYHKDYYSKNPQNQYCSLVVTPKLKKFQKVFADLIK